MTINFNDLTNQVQVTDTNANASIAVQPKGTGAIDLAAGSSGVNISNGGTVTAITRTAAGSGYTSVPSVAITAPTTAGGVQATATAQVVINSVLSITSGGSGYTVGDVLTVSGGTAPVQTSQLTVSTVSAGVITAVTITRYGTYSVVPTNPASVTGGTGTGATFTLDYAVQSGTFTITNAGSGYVEQPTVSFSGGGGSGAAAYATVGSSTVVKSLGSSLDFYTSNGAGFRVLDSGTTSSAYWTAYGTSSTPVLRAVSNISGQIGTASTVPLQFITNTSFEQFRVAHTASAVNYVQVTGAATGSFPVISAQGSDAATGLNFSSKSSARINFYNQSGVTSRQVSIGGNGATAVNYLDLNGSATGVAPSISAQGSDTNIPLVLQPKGTGALQAQLTDSAVTGGNVRGANAVDWQTARSNASNVASGQNSVVVGGTSNTSSAVYATTVGGQANNSSGTLSFIGGGVSNTAGAYAGISYGYSNTASGYFNFIGGGSTNSATSGSVVTTQATTTVTSGSTAITLSGSNANIKVGQLVSGTGIVFPTFVAAISGTSLTISQAANATGTPTLSFYTPHGVVVGGGNNQATGSYSFIGGGGDAGTAANRNTASGAWSSVVGGIGNQATGSASFIGGGGTDGIGNYGANIANNTLAVVVGGYGNTASGYASFIAGGQQNTANGNISSVLSGNYGISRGIVGATVFAASNNPIGTSAAGTQQGALYVLARQTTDATATVLCSNSSAASTVNQVIMPNNSAYYVRGSIVAGVTGGGDSSSWTFQGTIKRGANAASTALVAAITPTLVSQDAGASTWVVSVTADTTNGGLAVTVTGQAATTIRWVCKIETTEMTF